MVFSAGARSSNQCCNIYTVLAHRRMVKQTGQDGARKKKRPTLPPLNKYRIIQMAVHSKYSLVNECTVYIPHWER